MKRSLVVVVAFVVMNAVGFVAYRASYAPDASASRLPTSKHEAADTLSRESGASQAKVATPAEPSVAVQPTPEQHVAAPQITAQESVAEHTNSPTEETPRVQRTRVKQVARKHGEEAPAKPTVETKPVETKAAVETKAVESKPTVETKPADKAKDKVLEMEANPYKRGE
jgi:hypothetical protein